MGTRRAFLGVRGVGECGRDECDSVLYTCMKLSRKKLIKRC